MKYRTYIINGTTAYAQGKCYRPISNNTYQELKKLGVKTIIYKNGDFISI